MLSRLKCPHVQEGQGQFYMFPLVDVALAAGQSCCFICALGEQQGRARCISGPAAGFCAVGCSDADGDGQCSADTGHYVMSEICCFSVTVSLKLPVE